MKKLSAEDILYFAHFLDFSMEEAFYICTCFYNEKQKNNPMIRSPLENREDYIRFYEGCCCRYYGWEQLIEEQLEQGTDGLCECDCLDLIGTGIFPILFDLYIWIV